MTHPDNIVEKYTRVHALAQSGVGGEKENAARIVAQLRMKYPGIHEQAFPPAPPPFTGGQQRGQDTSVPWYERFNRARDMAAEAVDWATRVAAEMASLEYARHVAAEVAEVQTKMLQRERVQVSVKLPLRELYYLGERLSPQQKDEFAATIAAVVEAEILRLMNGED